jgi:hypothetical protein
LKYVPKLNSVNNIAIFLPTKVEIQVSFAIKITNQMKRVAGLKSV